LTSLNSAYSKPPREVRTGGQDAAQIHAYRNWLQSPAAMAQLSAAGKIRSAAKLIKYAGLVARLCAQKGINKIAPGQQHLAQLAGDKQPTVSRYLRELVKLNWLTATPSDEPGRAATLNLVFANCITGDRDPSTADPDPHCKEYALSENYLYADEYAAHDAFRRNHGSYKKHNPDAVLKPFGEAGLLALRHILAHEVDASMLAALMGVTYGSAAALLRRMAAAGVLDYTVGRRNHKVYSIVEEWRGAIESAVALMPTYQIGKRNQVTAVTKQLEYAKRFGATMRRIERLVRELKALEADLGYHGDTDPARWTDAHPRSARTWIRWDRAEEDRALADLRTEVQRLRLERVSPVEIRRMMNFAGYAPQDVSHALARVVVPVQEVAA
jgi:hypothetical protein